MELIIMGTIILDFKADVIDTAFVRQILFVCGYGATRDGDYLKVFEKRESYSLFCKLGNKEVFDTLYCDEGLGRDCLDNTGLVDKNKLWQEFCDMNNVMALILHKLSPEWQPKDTRASGRGFRWQHFNSEYREALSVFLPNSELANVIELKNVTN